MRKRPSDHGAASATTRRGFLKATTTMAGATIAAGCLPAMTPTSPALADDPHKAKLPSGPAQATGRIDRPVGVVPSAAKYGSDLVVDLLRALGIEYVALVPGSTFRGLHESFVSYGGNASPQVVLAIHENDAGAIAHGYAKAAQKPMGLALHNVVGLQSGCMSIYNAWCDRVPMVVLGGTGPIASDERARLDWVHTALVQGTLVRDYTKFDDQPASLGAIAESVLHAWRMAATPPCGPVYVCLDRGLQEASLDGKVTMPDVSRYAVSAPPAANPAAIAKAATLLAGARAPVVVAERAGRHAESFAALEKIAELVGAAMLDQPNGHNFRSSHAQNLSGLDDAVLAEADVILAVDVPHLENVLQGRLKSAVQGKRSTPARVVSISQLETVSHAWADNEMAAAVDVPMLADARVALPQLLERLAKSGIDGKAAAARRAELGQRHKKLFESWQAYREQHWNDRPISIARWSQELWTAIKDRDWSLVATFSHRAWAAGAWAFDAPGRYLGSSGGSGLGYTLGGAVGAALALKGSGKLPIAVIGDGDFLMSTSALWTAAHYELPLLVVVHDNRTFGADSIQQEGMAKARARPTGNGWIGTRLDHPIVDIPALARAFGVQAEPVVERPEDLGPVLARAVRGVTEGRTVVVDIVGQGTITQVKYPGQ